MLGRLRSISADVLMRIVDRLTSEPRYPAVPRVPSGAPTLAGVAITPDTAVTVSTVWACLRYLSQTVAVLPWHVMRDDKNGANIISTHPVDWLLWKRASPEWSSFQFRETLTHWALRWGNGFGEIEVDQLGRPYALWPIHPERVNVCRAQEDGYSTAGDDIAEGELYYEVSNGTGEKTLMAAKRMFHIRGFGEGPVGVNVISYASQSIGWARAAQLFGASFFGNGMNVAGVVTNKKPLTKAGLDLQKAQFEQLYKGVRNASKTAFLDNDADWKPIGVDPQKAQLIEVHQHLIDEVCRWFGAPPHKVMHLLRAHFANVENLSIEVVVDSITPWVKRFEDEADYKLFGQENRRGFYSRMNMKGLLRGDSAGRAALYKELWSMGAYTPNRILELEDENTIGADGDKHIVQLNLTTLEKVGEEPIAPPPAPTQAPASEPAVQPSPAQANALMRLSARAGQRAKALENA